MEYWLEDIIVNFIENYFVFWYQNNDIYFREQIETDDDDFQLEISDDEIIDRVLYNSIDKDWYITDKEMVEIIINAIEIHNTKNFKKHKDLLERLIIDYFEIYENDMWILMPEDKIKILRKYYNKHLKNRNRKELDNVL
jgi:hypothetical protein